MSEPGEEAHEATRTERRSGFGVEAERYDRVRPTYPDALFDAVAVRAEMAPGSRVLEIGPGTGQATVPMLDRGWWVEAVEIDPAMVAVLERRTGGRARIVTSAFETRAPGAPVDLVLAATSFHWLDPHDRVDRVADAVRTGGTLAVVWTRHVRGGTQDFFDAAEACYARHGGDDRAMPLLDAAAVRPPTEELTASPRFTAITTTRFTADVASTTADYIDLQRTYSPTIALPAPEREALLRCLGDLLERGFGGRVVKRTVFDLVLATRR